MDSHKLRLIFILIAFVVVIVSLVVLASMGKTEELPELTTGLLGALAVLAPALYDALMVSKKIKDPSRENPEGTDGA
jgi:hypothetical protein